MGIFIAFAVAGGLAQFVDGTLGMGFGVTSATVLLYLGVAPVTASAATHAAKLPTTFVSGISHWRAGNIDASVLWRLALPGMLGGFLGAVVLTNISMGSAKAWMSALLICLGLVIFAKFGLGKALIPRPRAGHTARWLGPIGIVGGFVDATGGGGWGPVATPSLMTVTAHEPRKVVGTVNAAEFLVAATVSIAFFTSAAVHDIPWLPVAGLVAGGVLIAPIAARLTGRLPHAPLGTLVGGLVILVNSVNVVAALGGLPFVVDLALMFALTAVTCYVAWGAWRRERSEQTQAAEAPGLATSTT
ncbi:MAG: sulfite exporter TauE/SafE family protein [Nocardioides sp.]